MSITASFVARESAAKINPRRALQHAVALWFCTAVAGQWVFVYYIANFYGRSTVTGDYAAWDRNRGLTDGYIAGDIAGNVFFAVHALLAAVLTFGGTLQLVPQIRRRALVFHRWNGRVFMITALGAASSGLWLEWVRGTGLRAPAGLASAISVTLNAVLILTFIALAWHSVRNKDIAAHQLWATFLFLEVNGTWFLRIGVRAWTVLTGGAFGAYFFPVWSFGAYLLPLAVYALYLRSRNASTSAQYAMAASLVVLTLIMGVGIVTTFLRKWGPLLNM